MVGRRCTDIVRGRNSITFGAQYEKRDAAALRKLPMQAQRKIEQRSRGLFAKMPGGFGENFRRDVAAEVVRAQSPQHVTGQSGGIELRSQ